MAKIRLGAEGEHAPIIDGNLQSGRKNPCFCFFYEALGQALLDTATVVSVFRLASVYKLFIVVTLITSSSSSVSQAKERTKAEQIQEENEKGYLRTIILEIMALAGGTTWYWLDKERQVADWDFPTWSERLTSDVIRYDNNPFHVNFAWHAANGSSFHFIARANNLDFYESVGVGLLASLTWEYALEYREKVSLNDIIFTTGAGTSIGEFIHMMGRYLHENPDDSSSSLARWTLGFPISLVKHLDGLPPLTIGKRTPIWHNFHLDYQLTHSDYSDILKQTKKTELLHRVHFDGKFVRLPGYRKVGIWEKYYKDAEFSEASFDLSRTSTGNAAMFFAETGLLGRYSQRIYKDTNLLSHSTQLGVSTAYRYYRDDTVLQDDRVGVFHFPGLAGDLNLFWNNLSVHVRGRLHVDFAGINAHSNTEWNAAFSEEKGKSILRKQGYYYGYGPSLFLATDFEQQIGHYKLSTGASLWKAQYWSDEGLDRTQNTLTRDQKSNDSITDAQIWVRLEHLPYNIYLGLSFQERRRQGQLTKFKSSTRLRKGAVHFGLTL